MNCYIIYSENNVEKNKHYINIYFEQCKKRNINIELLFAERITVAIIENTRTLLYDNNELMRPDFIILRAIDCDLTNFIESLNIPVFNNYKVSEITNNKFKTYKYVSNYGIKIMDTYLIKYGHYNSSFFDKNQFPLVIKPIFGQGGEGVYLAKSKFEMDRIFRQSNIDLIVQKAASDIGKDLRVYVIGKEIIAAIMRCSKNDFRANYSLGGESYIYELNDEEKNTVHKIIDLFDFGLVGIDFIFDKGKIVFNEIEDVVGSRTLFMNSNINIVGLYIDYIVNKINMVL